MPRDLCLADPSFDVPDAIDLLIGSGLYWKILCGAPRNSVRDQPALQNTKLGWIIGGEMCEAEHHSSKMCLTITTDMLHQQLERFWAQEEITETQLQSVEEKTCERQFIDTFKRDAIRRFVVRLPTRADIQLGESMELAMKRLMSLERRFKKNPDLKEEYVKFMKDYIEQKHMSLVSNSKN
ncbi:PREDICTED: uncharacterized protein LOC105556422 [Vollenhovia emeryi]|uniref:uncharacterized protein LOC105556422 n=1 Tax=Vollenhovia emeryi TaxID=411798 RepID=UPI0005F48BD7|nr:PREDICTED: uncharacterized protein LOC105556422 [Vollenhovia emeryi]